MAHTIVATEAEAAGFAKLVQMLATWQIRDTDVCFECELCSQEPICTDRPRSMTFQDDNTSEALPESGGQLSKPLTEPDLCLCCAAEGHSTCHKPEMPLRTSAEGLATA